MAVCHGSAAVLRLTSDLKAIRCSPPEGCSASPIDDSMFTWEASIFGPEDTPWEGGIYTLRLQFGERYPEKPPRCKFMCEMFHPNVYRDGNICMDTIQDAWSPVMSASSVLTSIQSLLTDPNCASPANPEAAQLYVSDRTAYNKKVRRIAAKSVESC